MCILKFQDYSNGASKIKLGLQGEGLDTNIVTDVGIFSSIVNVNQVNHFAILLDIILAKIFCFEVCKTNYGNVNTTSILLQTNKTATDYQVNAFESVLDDFLSIVCSRSELLARISSLFKKNYLMDPAIARENR